MWLFRCSGRPEWSSKLSEQSMWNTVREKMRGLDPVRVDNPADPGTPDVNYVEGWVELKQVDSWPKRPATPLRVPHFTPQQRVWLRRRVLSGGKAFLLLKVDRDWLLFRGDVAARVLGTSAREELIAFSLAFWPNSLPEEELRECLKNWNRPALSGS